MTPTDRALLVLLVLMLACDVGASDPAGLGEPVGSGAEAVAIAGGRPALVEEGRRLFFEETFGGNGRTCGSCHPSPTLVLTPADIAVLPPDDPFFAGVMDFDPVQAQQGMLRYPLGGSSLFEPDVTVFRAIPTIRNVRNTGPFTADGRATTLQEQALEAATLHLLDGAADRPGERLPTAEELDAIVAFEEAMREPETGGLGLRLKTAEAREGHELFFGAARCTACHLPPMFTDNQFHNILAPSGGSVPDPGRCRIEPGSPDCWSGSAFNTPQLRGIRNTAPFFHDNSMPTLRAVVEFYNSSAFSESPAAKRLGIGPLGLGTAGVDALIAFLEEL